DAAARGAAAKYNRAGFESLVSIYEKDRAQVEQGRVKALSAQPLWADKPPDWTHAAWGDFKAALLADGDHWRAWTDWYERRLIGAPIHLELERARVLEPSRADWENNEGPERVNRLLLDIEARFAPEPEPEPDGQPVSYYRVLWVGDRMQAELFPADAHSEDAEGYYDALCRTLRKLAAKTDRANLPFDQEAHDIATELLEALAPGLDALKPGIVGPALTQFSGLWADLETDDGKAQSSALTRSKVRAALGLLGDIAALSPRMGEILIGRQLLQFDGDAAREKILAGLDRIRFVFSLDLFEDILDPSALEPLRFQEEAIASLTQDIERATSLDMKARLTDERDALIKDQLLNLNAQMTALIDKLQMDDEAGRHGAISADVRRVFAKIRADLPDALAEEVIGLIRHTPAAVLIAALGFATSSPFLLVTAAAPMLLGAKADKLMETLAKLLKSKSDDDSED
ncbi:MAG: hypothetical protein ACFB2Z_10645, partial [Maricaulaceae bacterium]